MGGWSGEGKDTIYWDGTIRAKNILSETIDITIPIYLKLDQTTAQTISNGAPYFSTAIKTPIIYPNADSTTAIKINKADGSTNIVTIDTTNGRVGVGKTPGSTLDVNGTIKSTSTIEANSSSDASVWSIRQSGASTRLEGGASAGYFGTYTNHPMIIQTNNTERVRVDTAGKVGIGTTPSNILHTKETTNGASYVRIENASNGSSAIAGIYMVNDAGTGGVQQVFSSTYSAIPGVASAYRIRTDNAMSGGIIFDTGTTGVASAPIQFRTAGTNRIYIENESSGGKIGMGVSYSIGAKLHILSTTEQLRLGYDTSNYKSETISSTGSCTITLTGTTPKNIFSQTIRANGGYESSDGSSGLSATYNFDATTSGNITSMTFKNGILTAVTTLP